MIWVFFLAAELFSSCRNKPVPNQEMISLLQSVDASEDNRENIFCPEAALRYADSLLHTSPGSAEQVTLQLARANALLQLGQEQKAVAVLESLLAGVSPGDVEQKNRVMKDLALAYMRLGERTNCIHNHNAESCIYPVAGRGIYADKTAPGRAIELYRKILLDDPGDLESRWLMNIAFMTMGAYPQNVPPGQLLVAGNDDSLGAVKPFIDVAANLGLNTNNQAGGSIVDDFNNDGYLDLVTSSWSLKEPMHYCRNNGNGTFTDISDSSGLGYITGGLNMMQTDYNNDGLTDIFVTRGGWKGRFGKEPNSLLRNNGDGTFTDVTRQSGLLSFYPTQAATWNDFNNDGWLDVFIGNETAPGGEKNPCELYINNRNGTFTEVALQANCKISDYVKGVSSGDYDNDGRADIFISTVTGRKILLKNESGKNGPVTFKDVTQESGLGTNLTHTFPCWFWDYDNDGWLDILVCGYEFTQSLSWYAAAEAIGAPVGNSGKVILYRNNHDGTFRDVSVKTGLNKVAFAMGSNFGDIDNDGYLDFYLGTGNPSFKSLVPNKLFRNVRGEYFTDITTAARVGNLQKGHGVSFADMDNDGDEDIYIEMGGAYEGDSYENSLYLNPGQNKNHWVNILLSGTLSNKAAIGARIKVTFRDHDAERSVYRDVNSGGSFGSNPLRQHIGLGEAASIEKIEIYWPVTGKTQVLTNLPADINITVKEGDSSFGTYKLSPLDFVSGGHGLLRCPPH
ncbi:MAG: FG-GAP-like repeat-containing protein [Bacteroidota bacterium]